MSKPVNALFILLLCIIGNEAQSAKVKATPINALKATVYTTASDNMISDCARPPNVLATDTKDNRLITITFGGKEGNTLFATIQTSLYSVKVKLLIIN